MADGIPGDVQRAQADESAFNRLAEQNKRFILSCAYRSVNRFVTENDDEWSIALIAFHEAVKSYDAEKGDFHAFAAMVIRRRLIDYLKSEARHKSEIPVAPVLMDGDMEDGEEATALELEVRRREAAMSEEAAGEDIRPGSSPVKDEIAAVQAILEGYRFSFFDLASCSPKADKTKKKCAGAVACLLTNAALLKRMREMRALPMKELCEASAVPRKILERHRKYIIAAAEILNGEYPLLAEYMNYIRKAMSG